VRRASKPVDRDDFAGLTFQPGDVIATGTPAGVEASRRLASWGPATR